MRWRPSIRIRLTLLYGGLFFLGGTLLLGATYRMVVAALPISALERQLNELQARSGNDRQFQIVESRLDERKRVLRTVADRAWRMLVALTLGSVILGWFVAGRMLAPLRVINEHARRASSQNLSDRIALRGPPDELQQLADTFDDMLDRLERAFESQRQFSARVSHELRTPLAIIATSADNVLNRGDVSESDRQFARTVKEAAARCDRLIEGLLVIARSDSAAEVIHCDLAELAGAALELLAPVATANGVEMRDLLLEPAPVTGNPALLASLVDNLIENAIRHNVAEGWVNVRTLSNDDRAILSIENSGPPIDDESLEDLFQPFRRGTVASFTQSRGVGLGLAIVRAVARAHGAAIEATPRDGGGLAIEVSFPRGAAVR
jgi:signal transduction histidine kinase